MKNENLIKFRESGMGDYLMGFRNKLPNINSIKQKNYYTCNFFRKQKIANYLAKLLDNEAKEFERKINGKNLIPSNKWYNEADSLKVLALFQSYIISVKSYIESFIEFVALYLQDLEQRSVKVGTVNLNKKYKNLEKFTSNHECLDVLKRIRDISTHGKTNIRIDGFNIGIEGDINFAFCKNESGNLEPCLIEMDYSSGSPQERMIYYKSDLSRALEAVGKLCKEFDAYTTNKILNSQAM